MQSSDYLGWVVRGIIRVRGGHDNDKETVLGYSWEVAHMQSYWL